MHLKGNNTAPAPDHTGTPRFPWRGIQRQAPGSAHSHASPYVHPQAAAQCRRLLNDLLVAAAQAVALPKRYRFPIAITENLHLDVPCRDVFFRNTPPSLKFTVASRVTDHMRHVE